MNKHSTTKLNRKEQNHSNQNLEIGITEALNYLHITHSDYKNIQESINLS